MPTVTGAAHCVIWGVTYDSSAREDLSEQTNTFNCLIHYYDFLLHLTPVPPIKKKILLPKNHLVHPAKHESYKCFF